MADRPFKVGETYRTRDGHLAIIVSRVNHALLGRVVHAPERLNGWLAHSWSAETGVSIQRSGGFEPSGFDLLPPKREVWVAIWLDPQTSGDIVRTCAFTSESAAKLHTTHRWTQSAKVLGPVEIEDTS